MKKNPNICLYHSTDKEKIPDILKKGLDPRHIKACEERMERELDELGIEDPEKRALGICESGDVKARDELDDLLSRPEAVYSVKDKWDAVKSFEETLKVDASKIPCRCIEDNYDMENRLYHKIRNNFSNGSRPYTPQEEIWNLAEAVEHTIRYLDKTKNPYTTEVLCPCHVPAEAITRFDEENSCIEL